MIRPSPPSKQEEQGVVGERLGDPNIRKVAQHRNVAGRECSAIRLRREIVVVCDVSAG